jgi:hypothetical protein
MRGRLTWLAIAWALLVPGVALAQAADTRAAGAQTNDLGRLEEGMRLYRADGVDCEYCHDWQGGGKMHEAEYADVQQAGGPPLFTSTLDRAAMIELVSCGRIVGERVMVMPQYRGDAWTAGLPCWGKTFADITLPERPVHGKRQMNAREIEAVVDYVIAVYQGKRITVEWCLKYFPTSRGICDTLVR